jgi:hypothetical protein
MPNHPWIDQELCSWNIGGKVFGSRADRDIGIAFPSHDLYRNRDLC